MPQHDHTLRAIDDTRLITQKTRKTWSPQCNDNMITFPKCDTKDTLCNDNDDTCVTMHETFIMSLIYVYMINRTN